MYGLGEAMLVIASCILFAFVFAEIYYYIKRKEPPK